MKYIVKHLDLVFEEVESEGEYGNTKSHTAITVKSLTLEKEGYTVTVSPEELEDCNCGITTITMNSLEKQLLDNTTFLSEKIEIIVK